MSLSDGRRKADNPQKPKKMKNDIFTRIARVKVRLSSVCKFNLFYILLLVILLIVRNSFAQKFFLGSFIFLICFSVFFVIFARVFDHEDKKEKKRRGNQKGRIEEMRGDLD